MTLEWLEENPPWDWPKDTGEFLLGILDDHNAQEADRVLAAELAGDFTVVNDEIAAKLLEILRDDKEPEQLRATAAVSFGPALESGDIDEFDDLEMVPISEQMFHTIIATLQDLYQKPGIPKVVRRHILEGAVRSPRDWQPDAVRHAYNSGDPEWMLTASFGMRYVRGLDDLILDALKSDDEGIHFHAVCAAGSAQVEAAWEYVSELATSPDTEKQLRLAAIEAVGDIRPEEARSVLEDLILDRDEEISEAASEAIQMAELGIGEDLSFDDSDDDFSR